MTKILWDQVNQHMMSSYFVFHHNLNVLTKNIEEPIDEILKSYSGSDLDRLDDLSIGYPCLFKQNITDEGIIVGRLLLDEVDMKQLKGNWHVVNYPRAEYLFSIFNGTLTQIGNFFKAIEEYLEQKEIYALTYPLMVFPDGLPEKFKQQINIEIWTPTSANVDGEERPSDHLQDALPRQWYNFYTW